MDWTDRAIVERSKGHWAWACAPGVGLVEYIVGRGEVYRCPASNVIDCGSGYRLGRWEGPDRPGMRESIRDVWRSPASFWEEVSA